MAKVFTITEGLENLGALKSGGQGSVYKARRSGELVTAVKILPTPISSESDADKNFISFQNEVQKLKKVNEIHNPNVVSIITSGITSSGNLPFIEMEYIEGPDLAELLKPPYEPVFTIKETLRVADHLASALAHCHRAEVKHGDIKSNNVKFNERTGNYMILDFGLSVMSDEQRRTSMRYAGAIEFMAPEQSAGETLFETDIYSFGIILFELLSGSVPFPLSNKGEMARNAVMVAHMEKPVPDLLPARRQVVSGLWNNDKIEREMAVPGWLTEMIYRCLEKSPDKRFKNGTELQHFIHARMIDEENRNLVNAVSVQEPFILPVDESKYTREIQKLELQAIEKDHKINELKYQIEQKDSELYQLNMERYNAPNKKGISTGVFFFVLTLALGLGGYNIYHSFINPSQEDLQATPVQADSRINNSADSLLIAKTKTVKKTKPKTKKPGAVPVTNKGTASQYNGDREFNNHAANKYKVTHIAFFYAQPDAKSRNNYYVTVGDAVLTALNEKDEFVYVEFVSSQGRAVKGWLSKKDLSLTAEE
ncbi:MAG TPA: serine/threonine-protein kinase [Ferruginibacter sp.]|nr:serine/threonine-protein kinase [Ferruginibacter sp.]